jgi:uncharacterized protein YecE (DUF72 family)
MQCTIHIGTSGWHYKHWQGPFYPAGIRSGDQLSWYARLFDTVELNNTFYHLPSESALKAWRDGTPENFCFSVKGSRYLTHMRKLKEPEAGLNRFMPLIATLGQKLGPILFQLPPRWQCNPDRLHEFLKTLPTGHRYGFELRDRSWHVPEVYRLLERYNAAFCIYELAGVHSPLLLTADFTYVRLHGPGKAYQGNYRTPTLRQWAERIAAWRSHLKAVYFYFDNDQAGYAPRNALKLRQLVGNETETMADSAGVARAV